MQPFQNWTSFLKRLSKVNEANEELSKEIQWGAVAPQGQGWCPPLAITDSELRATVTSFGAAGIARFSCTSSHVLVGGRTMRCLPQGDWSGSVPHCKRMFPLDFWYYVDFINTLADEVRYLSSLPEPV
ncbi:unnamed protein product [Gongylonema pulchrum]|uniref:Sushi domain-containing protein n=1 Tax=Gongylonema pulchrum TaxID=637853 RepID=A0A183DL02_9BILA|nr:unnamed protein product [Gongylonema pulchrum]